MWEHREASRLITLDAVLSDYKNIHFCPMTDPKFVFDCASAT